MSDTKECTENESTPRTGQIKLSSSVMYTQELS